MKLKDYCLIILLVVVALSGCKLDDESPTLRNTYNFIEDITLEPFKKEYNQGDILWLEVRLPNKMLQDVDSGESQFISNARFNVTLHTELLEIEPLPQVSSRFDIAMQSGELFKEDDFETTGNSTLFYGCPDNGYVLRAGLQLKEAGNYVLFLNRDIGATLITFTDDSDCSLQNIIPPPAEANLGYVQYFFETDDTNLDVFESLIGTTSNPQLERYREALATKKALFLSVR